MSNCSNGSNPDEEPDVPPSVAYQAVIDRCMVPMLDRMKVLDVKRLHVASMKAAGVTQVGTHGIRHRSAMDIASLGFR